MLAQSKGSMSSNLVIVGGAWKHSGWLEPQGLGVLFSSFYFEGIRVGAAVSLSFPSLLQSSRGALIPGYKKRQ